MRILLLVLALGAVNCYMMPHPPRDYDYKEPMTEEFVRFHNSLPFATWKATTENFKNVPQKDKLAYVKQLCGTWLHKKNNKPPVKTLFKTSRAVPDTFDARTEWPNCPSVKEVRDQGACGSCWAFGCVEAATDRICIQSQGKYNFHLAAEELTSCCHTCGNGCDGGFLMGAWEYLKRDGIVTGGQYSTHQGCYPYEIKACDHHVVGKLQPCKGDGPTPRCKKECESGYNNTFKADKHYASRVYAVESVENIQKEIMTNGPVEAAFTVYADFPAYKSGVYKHESGSALGGHAIKILGWGTESGTPYWLVANSWNPDWGDNGYFKILRGDDECGIESNIVAGMMKF